MTETTMHTAVITANGGEYHGTCLARTETALIEQVRENFDPEGEYAGPTEGEAFWEAFAGFWTFDIHRNVHVVSEPEPEPQPTSLAGQMESAGLLPRSKASSPAVSPEPEAAGPKPPREPMTTVNRAVLALCLGILGVALLILARLV